nr:HNH endonuclease [Micromonospora sp. DSM 115978]
MNVAWSQLGGRRRTLARLVYQRDRATPGYVCPVCKQAIDWTLPYKDSDGQVNPWSKSVDHADETQDGGALTDLANLWTAHLGCNSSKGASRRHERAKETRAAQGAVICVDVHSI